MMPEFERDASFDPDEEYAWDCDLSAAGESETFDLLDDEE